MLLQVNFPDTLASLFVNSQSRRLICPDSPSFIHTFTLRSPGLNWNHGNGLVFPRFLSLRTHFPQLARDGGQMIHQSYSKC